MQPLFNNFAGRQACNFIEMRLQRRCFPVNISKFLRIAFLENTFAFGEPCSNS